MERRGFLGALAMTLVSLPKTSKALTPSPMIDVATPRKTATHSLTTCEECVRLNKMGRPNAWWIRPTKTRRGLATYGDVMHDVDHNIINDKYQCDVCGKVGHHWVDALDCTRRRVARKYHCRAVVSRTTHFYTDAECYAYIDACDKHYEDTGHKFLYMSVGQLDLREKG